MNFQKLFDYSQPLVAAATLIVIGVLAATLYVGSVLYNIKVAGDTIEVTGSAKEAVIADTGRWVISLEARTGIDDQQVGFARLDAAVNKITGYLKEQGFENFETPSVSTYPIYSYPQYGEPTLTGHSVTRNVIVRSSDIEGLNALANNLQPFSGAGYTVSTGSLELTVSNLPEMRVRLLSEAIKDATDRANAIAQDSGRGVSTLRNASSGVVQVLAEGGIDISDYGSYDTMSMNKEVMVTVRATFGLK